ncbi:alpha/beta hydrolase [Flavobacterium sp.]|uniref:alpha/beta hydrolase n=1 Tax=Flavobacterium sp. TaxID=239 RepID=UPI002633F278|nr:alpha/beta hydrolase [Flavobacterium sp.]
MRPGLIFIFLLFLNQIQGQQTNNLIDSNKQNYLAEVKIIGKKFADDFYPNYARFYSLPEKLFLAKIDSARKDFITHLDRYKSKLETKYIQEQQIEIKYYFDKLLIEYPVNHDIYIGKTSSTPFEIPEILKSNLADFNKPELVENPDFTTYVKAFLSYQINLELKKSIYKNLNNQQLNAVWKLIPKFISNPKCKAFWQFDFLYSHIDNNGIKDIDNIYTNFKSTCKDTAYLKKINSIYREDSIGRQGHLIRTYKTVGPVKLDIHMFLPDNIAIGNKRSVIIYFHGGSWSEGKPDWFFYACSSYAKKGWIACAVEYRTYGRHGTLPFSAVMDAKSAIRWLRQHSNEYNIDTNKIVASGNSAGGHLILCAALADKWNEETDDIKFSPAPNVLMVNSGVYDLTDQNTAWIRKDLKDKNLVKEISPDYLIKKNIPSTLIIHGTDDHNVSYSTAKLFVEEMAMAGNNNIEFQTLKGAGHFIWFDPKYSSEVSKLRSEFLTKLGY